MAAKMWRAQSGAYCWFAAEVRNGDWRRLAFEFGTGSGNGGVGAVGGGTKTVENVLVAG